MPLATSTRVRLRAVVWSLAFLVVGYQVTRWLVSWALGYLVVRFPAIAAGPVGPGLIQAAIGVFVFGALTWGVGRRKLGLSWETLGWPRVGVGVRGFGRGFGVALAIGLTGLLLSVALGHAGWRLDGGSFGAYLGRLGVLALVLLPAAFMEELAFRGTGLAGLSAGVGRGRALLVTAVLFALAHWQNPGITALALGNIALAGTFLGLTFFARGGMWTATGAHLGWNLALAGSAAPVSGLPFDIPWIDFNSGDRGWLTGGGFGPEGGLAATIALAVGVIWVSRWHDFHVEENRG